MSRLAFIKATTLGDAWFQALYKVMTEGRRYLVTEGSYAGIHRSGLPVVINIEYPASRPIFPTMPEGSNIPAPTTEDDINDYVHYLITPDRKPNEHYTYGEDLYWQIEWVIENYKKGGFGNNHCYMTVGRPETVHFYDRDVDYREIVIVRDHVTRKNIKTRRINNEWNKNPEIKPSSQCLRGIDTWIDENRLNFWVYFRSWDLWGGFPVNLGGIQCVKEYMAAKIGVEDGSMIVSCKDLHVYEHTWIVALMRLGKEEKEV
ncbi:MAG: hypothetical protein A2Y98_00195 [Candidatus Portnoybacteria bacterium RBG_19FT_COMBO_36_7]|uniref:Thymidylate synthase/dCMP hydroxymethylase domain-containing protein n=1 Tax=Candidatus Portnoybacteria bacterium RBG_19FT_COMBO_36_7 TaxID=1801992 RepID=A0A1G2F8E6_9BACT|nr:MAG: hypothetical protein A2Y98_00195 [Candidatus Portnoybacteria bacterium RBG_19FT_COMBO_36_7]